MKHKQADWANHVGAYGGVGAGTFALAALFNEIQRQHKAQQQTKRQELPEDALVVDLPNTMLRNKLSQDEQFAKTASGVIDHALSALIGLPVGFTGAKLLYDKYKEKQVNREIDDTNLKYLQTLQALQQKSAELNTPHVDAFCKAAAAELSKVAGAGGWKSLLPAGLAAAVGGGLYAKDLASPLPQSGTVGEGLDTAKKMWTTSAILASLATAGAMVHAGQRKNKPQGNIPSTVALNYEDIPAAATLAR